MEEFRLPSFRGKGGGWEREKELTRGRGAVPFPPSPFAGGGFRNAVRPPLPPKTPLTLFPPLPVLLEGLLKG